MKRRLYGRRCHFHREFDQRRIAFRRARTEFRNTTANGPSMEAVYQPRASVCLPRPIPIAECSFEPPDTDPRRTAQSRRHFGARERLDDPPCHRRVRLHQRDRNRQLGSEHRFGHRASHQRCNNAVHDGSVQARRRLHRGRDQHQSVARRRQPSGERVRIRGGV